jgi:TolA-binding protein
MTALAEIHPDDLLDREARGELSSVERLRLDEHLATCSVCCFERDVRADFRGDFEELARLDAAPPPPSTRQPRGRKRVASRMRVTALAAAALLFAGAAAAEWSNLLGRRALSSVVESAGSSEVAPAPAAPQKPRSDLRRGTPAPIGSDIESDIGNDGENGAPLDGVTEPDVLASSSSAPIAPLPHALARAAVAAGPARTAVVAAVPLASSAPADATPPASASTLFSEAGDARRRGAYDDAERLYGELAQRFPQSPEALNAHAILARLLLDRGDAAGALVHFDAYLRSGAGSLREEAMVGRALALERLGRASDEAAAWNALLDAYPQSVHAARARARSAALGGR